MGKRAAISKLACVSQKRIRSYIVLALKSIYDETLKTNHGVNNTPIFALKV